MSMDMLMRADEQAFVSEPTSFRNFYIFAKQSQREIEEGVTIRKLGEDLNQEQFDKIMGNLDVSDLRRSMYNPEIDDTIERNQMLSQKIIAEEKSRRRNAQYKSIALRDNRYDNIDLKVLARKSPYLYDQKHPEVVKKKEVMEIKQEFDADTFMMPDVDYSDLIISVSIYFGYPRELEYHEIRLGRLMKVTDRIELTGEHTFDDLRKSFSCPADFVFTEDASEKPPSIESMAKKKYPSSMFFIHDTFFVDKETNETAQLIERWAERQGAVGHFQTELMSTKLGELTARLGQPYVYIHQGVCEHLVVINDISIRDETHQNVTFPRRLVEKNFRRIACHCCKEQSAKWMILEHDELMPHCPGYACTDCYRELCFDVKSGKKVGSFKAVPYCDRKEIGDGGKFLEELRFSTKIEKNQ